MKTYPPTADELRDFMDTHGLTSRDVGRLLRMSDPDARAVRYWVRGKRVMPFAAWHTLVVLVEGEQPGVQE